MATTMKKTTERLNWNTLVCKYNALVAVDSTTAKDKLFEYLNEAIEHDANDLKIDTMMVLKAVKNNCVSDKKTRLKADSYIAMRDIKNALLSVMTEYVNERMPVTSNSPTELPKASNSKPRWQLTIEEMDAIDAHDYKALDSIYQNMASKKAKQPEAIVATMTMEEFTINFKHISELRTACKQYAKNPVPVVSDNLSAKLEAGKTRFTAEEVEELRKLLNK